MISRRNFCLLSGATALSLRTVISGQNDSVFSASVFRSFHGTGRLGMPFRLFVPKDYNEKRSFPLALWLHGVNGRGKDNLAQISEANKFGSHVWTFPENQAKNPCIVVVPQCADEKYWAAG